MRPRTLLAVGALSGRAVLLLGVAIAGCASGNRRPPLSIRVVGDTLPLLRSSAGASLEASAVIHNNGKRAVYYTGTCGPGLQRQMDSGWRYVWDNQVCLLVRGRPVRVAPGDSVVASAQFFGSTLPNHLPRVDPRVQPGLYRLVFGFALKMDPKNWDMSDYLPTDQRSSAPFVLVEKSVER